MFSLENLEFLDKERQRVATGKYRDGFGIFKGYTLPSCFKHMQKDIEDFEVYDDDIWITSFPKSGTTWCQEMVWCICHDLDFETTKEDTDTRMTFLEFSCMFYPSNGDYSNMPEMLCNSVEITKNAKRPRIIKTHLPFELLPKQIQTFEKKPKIIHIYRNVKDSCVSLYHFQRLFVGFKGDFDLFSKLFITGKLNFTPAVDNILSYFQHKDKANFCFIRFEDMKSNLHEVILQVCSFFNKSFNGDNIKELMQYLSFESMKTNPYVCKHQLLEFAKSIGQCNDQNGHFIRKGKSGGYKSDMNKEIEDIFDEHLKVKLEGTGLILN